MKKRGRRIFVYGGPQVFYAAKERPSGHPNAPAYVLETEHLRVKAQRDKLLEAVKACVRDYDHLAHALWGGMIEMDQLPDYEGAERDARDMKEYGANRATALRAAIAECEAP